MRCAPPPAPRPTARPSRPPERSAGSARPIAWPRCAGRSRTSPSSAGCSAPRPGAPAQLHDLHTSRLRFFLGGAIDTTVRGFLYEAAGTTVPAEVLAEGERIARTVGEQNAMPMAFLRTGAEDREAWLPRLAPRSRTCSKAALAPRPPRGRCRGTQVGVASSRASRCSRIRAVAPQMRCSSTM